MRILVIGAGAIGGYFGGRLLEAGRDVTFLVRAPRAAQLAAAGLEIRSPLGDAHIAAPRTIVAEAIDTPFDLVLVSCKAYDLAAAAESFSRAVGPRTSILPLLNGMRHIDLLGELFGDAKILGGTALISTMLDSEERVIHLNSIHDVAFGERSGGTSERVAEIAAEFSHARFNARVSQTILNDMWEKWVFIASLAGATCLMRGTLGDIGTAEARAYAFSMLDESAAVARAAGFGPNDAFFTRVSAMLETPGSPLTASMLRDVERRARTEEDHIIGDLIRRGEASGAPPMPLMRLASAHLRTYEARRARESAA